MSEKSSEIPSEWYILIEQENGEGYAYKDPCTHTHHAEVRVIEYKAYNELQEREQKLKAQLAKAIEQRNKYIKLSCAWAEECYSYYSETEIINVCEKEISEAGK